MRRSAIAMAGAALALPMLLSAPSQARTAYQYWAQGHNAYVSSTAHPPYELQRFLVGDFDGAYPPPPPGAYYPGAVPPPYGYDGPDY